MSKAKTGPAKSRNVPDAAFGPQEFAAATGVSRETCAQDAAQHLRPPGDRASRAVTAPPADPRPCCASVCVDPRSRSGRPLRGIERARSGEETSPARLRPRRPPWRRPLRRRPLWRRRSGSPLSTPISGVSGWRRSPGAHASPSACRHRVAFFTPPYQHLANGARGIPGRPNADSLRSIHRG